MGAAFCVMFGVCQITGAILPQFANIHSNAAPLLLGILLLLPGSIFAAGFGNMDSWLQTILLFAINFVTWYLIRKMSLKEKRTRTD